MRVRLSGPLWWSGFSPKRHFTETAFHRSGISPNALIRVGSPNDLRRAFGELGAAFHLLLIFTEFTINSLNYSHFYGEFESGVRLALALLETELLVLKVS